MTTVCWGAPVSIESAYESRILSVNGKTVGELARWVEDGVPKYASRLAEGDEHGPFDDAWEAMEALEVEVGVRPIGHCEFWGLPGAAAETEYLNEKFGVEP